MKLFKLLIAMMVVTFVVSSASFVMAKEADIDVKQSEELNKGLTELEKYISSIRTTLEEHQKNNDTILKTVEKDNEA